MNPPTSVHINSLFDSLVALNQRQLSSQEENINLITQHLLLLNPEKWKGLSSRPPFDHLRKSIISQVIQLHGPSIHLYLHLFNDGDKALLFHSNPNTYCYLLQRPSANSVICNNPQITNEQLLSLFSMMPIGERAIIQSLDISKTQIVALEPLLTLFPNLTTCIASGCPDLEILGLTQQIETLTSLFLSNSYKLRSLHSIVYLTHLQELDLSGCRLLSDTSGIESLPLLSLQLKHCNRLKDFSFLSSLTYLTELDLSYIVTFSHAYLQTLKGLSALQKIHLSNTTIMPKDIQTFPHPKIFQF